MVPDSKSRDEIGKQTQVSLREYFHSMYGPEDSIPYQEVQYDVIQLSMRNSYNTQPMYLVRYEVTSFPSHSYLESL